MGQPPEAQASPAAHMPTYRALWAGGTGLSFTSSLVPAAPGPTSQPPNLEGGVCHMHLGWRGGKMGSHDPAFQEA